MLTRGTNRGRSARAARLTIGPSAGGDPGSEEVLLPRAGDRLELRVAVEPAQEAADVVAHRCLREPEAGRDPPGAHAVGEQAEDLALARAEPGGSGGGHPSAAGATPGARRAPRASSQEGTRGPRDAAARPVWPVVVDGTLRRRSMCRVSPVPAAAA